MKILVCDDEPAVSQFILMVLEPEGHQMETAFDGQDALEKILANPNSYDVLITDNRMPRLTGDKLIEKLRALELPLKIMMITGFVSQLDPRAGNNSPFDTLLPKPFRAAELLNCLNSLVN